MSDNLDINYLQKHLFLSKSTLELFVCWCDPALLKNETAVTDSLHESMSKFGLRVVKFLTKYVHW